jgi:hypothetical protein
MRQRIAVAVAVLAVGLLAGLAALFARAQNPSMAMSAGEGVEPSQPSAPATVSTPTELTAAEAPRGAARQSSPEPSTAAEAAGATVQTPDSLRGRVVFDSLGCARCHSVAGVGSPRYPLDGVGARRNAAQLRAWTQGADALADSLPPSALRTKQSFQALKPEDLNALVAFLRSLKR